MQRRILIIDDHDDLASALSEVFIHTGHHVQVAIDRDKALAIPDLDGFDVIITDLDVPRETIHTTDNGTEWACMPKFPSDLVGSNAKVFKLCASNYRLEDFNEEDLKNLVATVLDYKLRFVDKVENVRHLHETIEFELPSAISLMHVVLDYLMKRVERLGEVDLESSNLFVALDEAFVNAVKHGNKFEADKLIRIRTDISKTEARFTIEDEGDGFDVGAIPDPLDPQNLFKTSGRGVLFIYNIMDEVIYNERGNRLTMVKKVEKNKMG